MIIIIGSALGRSIFYCELLKKIKINVIIKITIHGGIKNELFCCKRKIHKYEI